MFKRCGKITIKHITNKRVYIMETTALIEREIEEASAMLEEATAMLASARRAGDLNAMAELQYARIPKLKQRIEKLQREQSLIDELNDDKNAELFSDLQEKIAQRKSEPKHELKNINDFYDALHKMTGIG